MKQLLLILLLIALAFYTTAQNAKLDSLQAAYKTAKADTSKILTLIEIADEYIYTDPDTTIVLATLALEKSEKIGYVKGKAWAYNRIGIGYMNQGNYHKVLDIVYHQRLIYYTLSGASVVSGGFILVFLLSVLIFRSRQKERTAKRLLSQKNEELNHQKEEIQQMNEEIQVKSDALEEKNKEITDSITYAQRIQQAILPLQEEMHNILPQHFVLFKSKQEEFNIHHTSQVGSKSLNL